ncbi:hypothetical protein AAFF_G00341080 [Aldrovandia affinis]|uniref:Uncharacterized protein n=1 Tax=Aldrovandia affinis TaxID=143900 RepID=A0AAD7SKZ0_9TELE|nr:hypothetical protein AAFF_G00341080 [Aldrovandia affinis]
MEVAGLAFPEPASCFEAFPRVDGDRRGKRGRSSQTGQENERTERSNERCPVVALWLAARSASLKTCRVGATRAGGGDAKMNTTAGEHVQIVGKNLLITENVQEERRKGP